VFRKLPARTPVVHTIPRRSAQALLRKDIRSGLDKLAVLCKRMSTLREDSDGEQFRATWVQKWDPWGIYGHTRPHSENLWVKSRSHPQFILQFSFMVQFSVPQSSFMPMVSTGPPRHRSTPSTHWINFSSLRPHWTSLLAKLFSPSQHLSENHP
jgi:hypothetical protein